MNLPNLLLLIFAILAACSNAYVIDLSPTSAAKFPPAHATSGITRAPEPAASGPSDHLPWRHVQLLTAYSRNDCVWPQTTCMKADRNHMGVCYFAVDNNGGSIALSSYTICGGIWVTTCRALITVWRVKER